jgi:hypothetical protein
MPLKAGAQGVGIAVGTLLILASTVFAWNEPDNFRGVPWGASEQQVREKNTGMLCYDAKGNPLGERACGVEITIGSVPTSTFFVFRNGKFMTVLLTFEPKDFSEMEGIFAERYGKPTRTEELEGRTPAGLSFVDIVHEWTGQRIHIMLKKYAGKSMQSIATIGSRSQGNPIKQSGEPERRKAATGQTHRTFGPAHPPGQVIAATENPTQPRWLRPSYERPRC